MRGVPVRIELGPRDIAKEQCVLVPRDGSGKRSVPLAGLSAELSRLLDDVQAGMLARARSFVAERTSDAATLDGFRANLAARPGYVRVFWCRSKDCENGLIDATKTTPRNMPLAEQGRSGRCIICSKETTTTIYYARTY
jgi:prolyl-tRNA synthetase